MSDDQTRIEQGDEPTRRRHPTVLTWDDENRSSYLLDHEVVDKLNRVCSLYLKDVREQEETIPPAASHRVTGLITQGRAEPRIGEEGKVTTMQDRLSKIRELAIDIEAHAEADLEIILAGIGTNPCEAGNCIAEVLDILGLPYPSDSEISARRHELDG